MAEEIKNAAPEKQENKKLTYEQLEALAGNLSEQSKKLYDRLMEQNYQNVITRLELLFKVVENKEVFGTEFLAKCVKEIENTLTLPEKQEEPAKEE